MKTQQEIAARIAEGLAKPLPPFTREHSEIERIVYVAATDELTIESKWKD